MKTFFFLLLAAFSLKSFAVSLDVKNFGAKGDGATVDTAAIQKAIDECSKQGGGAVSFPKGEFVSGTILLKDNVQLIVNDGASLLGSTNIADYQAPDKFLSGNGAEMGYAFIAAVDVHNATIEGGGLIDGRGKELLAARPKGNSARPFLIRLVRSTGISVMGMRLQGPAAWTMHISQCTNVTAVGVTIRSRGLANNDGIDIDSSERVQVSNCDIDSGDDAICLKATSLKPCRDITIQNCKLKSHWAAIKFGTESAANFENVKITRCEIRDTEGGGIKLLSVDGAHLQNILISDLTMENVNVPLFIRLGARLKTFRVGDKPQPVGTVSNVVVKNLRAQATSPIGILMSGIPGHDITAVSLENIEIKLPGGGTRETASVTLPEKESAYPEITMFGKEFPAYGLFARHVNGLHANNVKLEVKSPDSRPAIVCEDGRDLTFSDWSLPTGSNAGFAVRFQSVHGARILGFKPELTNAALKLEDCSDVATK